MIEAVRGAIATSAGAMACLEWPAPQTATLLFAHANGFNAATYRNLLAPLCPGLRIIACDLRGHGFSTLPAQPGLVRNWTVFRDDLVALLAAIPGDHILLAGHSLGATAGFMAAAASAPQRVRALVLLEPVFLDPLPAESRKGSNSLAEMAAQRRRVFPSFVAAMDYYRGRGIFARWPEAVLADYLSAGLKENTDGSFRLACEPEWEAEIFRELPFGIASIAGSIKCPITIVRGTIASTAADDQVASILGARPDARVVTVEGASHFLPLEQPEHPREEILRAAGLLQA